MFVGNNGHMKIIGKCQIPLIGYDDTHYHNHDPNDDVDEEWFQGRDGWD